MNNYLDTRRNFYSILQNPGQPRLPTSRVNSFSDQARQLNAKSPSGAYTGVRDYLAIFLAGKLDQMGVTREQCKDAEYGPFPDLERLKR